MDIKKIGKFLRELRCEQNLTQEELGEKLGATNKTISRWETGAYMPPADILLAMSKLYDVSVNEILSGERLATADYQSKAEQNIVTSLNNSATAKKHGKKIAIICSVVILALIIISVVLLSFYLRQNTQYVYYTVEFNTNGGDKIKPQKIMTRGGSSVTIFEPNVPIKQGYSFVGWYSVNDLQNPWDFNTDVITESITLYAKWEEATDGLSYHMTYDETGNNLVYHVIRLGKTTDDNIIIPSHYAGKPVVAIGSGAFMETNISSVSIPSSIKTIGASAFENCRHLKQVTVPDSVVTIGYNAFSECRSLTNIVIGSSVTAIQDGAFAECGSLVEIYNRSQLPLTIGSKENGCVALNALNVYTSINGQSKLVFTDDDFVFYVDEQSASLIRYLGSDTDIELPNKFNGGGYDINQHAFAYCNNVSNINIPSCVKKIGQRAFYNSSIVNVILSEGVQTIGADAFSNCYLLQSAQISNSVISIDGSLFANCSKLQSVNIPDGITTIPFGMFYNCASLTNIRLPNTLQIVENSAFYNCEKLEDISFPESLTTLNPYSFYNCGIKNLVIPKNLEKYSVAMVSCKKLQSITVDKDNPYFYSEGNCLISRHANGDCIVLGCNNSVISHNPNITKIAGFSFIGCENLTSLFIPDNITMISGLAFGHCNNLQSLIVSPNNPVYHSYENCIIETATKTLIYMFKNSVIPNYGSVSTIDSLVLTYDFANEVEIAIPISVTSIYKDAFRGSELDGKIVIKYDGTVEQWQQIKIIDHGSDVGGLPSFVKAVICTDGEISR